MKLMSENNLSLVSLYRDKGYKIHYYDRTCTNIWENVASEVMKTDSKVPAGKGNRYTVYHLGDAETGLL